MNHKPWDQIIEEGREVFKKRRGSQAEVARELGLKTSAFHDYLTGALEPRVSMGIKIMDAIVREKKRQAANAAYAAAKGE